MNIGRFRFDLFDSEIVSALRNCAFINLPFEFSNVCPEINYLLTKCGSVFFKKDSNISKDIMDCKLNTNIVLDLTWEKINTGHWKDVDKNWRYVYTLATLFKVLCLLLDTSVNKLSIIKLCDKGILMGAPLMQNILSKIAFLVSNTINQPLKQAPNSHEKMVKKCKLESSFQSTEMKFSILEKKEVSHEEFINIHFKKNEPVVFVDAIVDWPALSSSPWSVDYILEKARFRTVPVEIGSKYTDEKWTQRLMTVEDFIIQYIWNKSEQVEIGYLAQHNLFDQIPELCEDIKVPFYITSSGNVDVDINVWFGPGGTISPLHFDPKHNLLAQVIGEKYIRLYSKEMTKYVYPRENTWLSNTSQVDVENPDFDVFPLFKEAPYQEYILKPGCLLYIPPGCWHYVRSLSTSLSISFWW